MEKLLHIVGDLPPSARSVVESLMGHALRDNQQVYIVAVDAAKEPSVEQRREAWIDLQEIMHDMHTSVRQTGIAAAEVERTIDQACDEVRYGN